MRNNTKIKTKRSKKLICGSVPNLDKQLVPNISLTKGERLI